MQNLSSNSVNKMSTNAKCFSQTVSETALYLPMVFDEEAIPVCQFEIGEASDRVTLEHLPVVSL